MSYPETPASVPPVTADPNNPTPDRPQDTADRLRFYAEQLRTTPQTPTIDQVAANLEHTADQHTADTTADTVSALYAAADRLRSEPEHPAAADAVAWSLINAAAMLENGAR